MENIEVVRCFQNKAWKIPDFEKLFSSIYQFSMRSHHTLISFENIPGLKLKEFYLVLDQLKYLKYVIGVFSPYITDRKFQSSRLIALTSIKKSKKNTAQTTSEEIKKELRENIRDNCNYVRHEDGASGQSSASEKELFPDLE